jgi:hypothetical protein
MGLMKKIKELEDKVNIGKLSGYKFNKWVFNIMIILMVFLVFLVWAEYDYQSIRQHHIYLECESPNAICENNFYNLCNNNSIMYRGHFDICDNLNSSYYQNEFLYEGESIGHKPSFLASNISDLFLILVIGAFFLNHGLYNRKVKK